MKNQGYKDFQHRLHEVARGAEPLDVHYIQNQLATVAHEHFKGDMNKAAQKVVLDILELTSQDWKRPKTYTHDPEKITHLIQALGEVPGIDKQHFIGLEPRSQSPARYFEKNAELGKALQDAQQAPFAGEIKTETVKTSAAYQTNPPKPTPSQSQNPKSTLTTSPEQPKHSVNIEDIAKPRDKESRPNLSLLAESIQDKTGRVKIMGTGIQGSQHAQKQTEIVRDKTKKLFTDIAVKIINDPTLSMDQINSKLNNMEHNITDLTAAQSKEQFQGLSNVKEYDTVKTALESRKQHDISKAQGQAADPQQEENVRRQRRGRGDQPPRPASHIMQTKQQQAQSSPEKQESDVSKGAKNQFNLSEEDLQNLEKLKGLTRSKRAQQSGIEASQQSTTTGKDKDFQGR